jgi:hypothetical protein
MSTTFKTAFTGAKVQSARAIQRRSARSFSTGVIAMAGTKKVMLWLYYSYM